MVVRDARRCIEFRFIFRIFPIILTLKIPVLRNGRTKYTAKSMQGQIKVMDSCGPHTVALFRSGIRPIVQNIWRFTRIEKYHQQSLADSTQRRSFEGMAHIHEALESDGNDQPDGRVAADVAKERNELTGVLRQRMNVDAKDLLEPANQKSEMKHTEVENTYGQKIHVR